MRTFFLFKPTVFIKPCLFFLGGKHQCNAEYCEPIQEIHWIICEIECWRIAQPNWSDASYWIYGGWRCESSLTRYGFKSPLERRMDWQDWQDCFLVTSVPLLYLHSLSTSFCSHCIYLHTHMPTLPTWFRYMPKYLVEKTSRRYVHSITPRNIHTSRFISQRSSIRSSVKLKEVLCSFATDERQNSSIHNGINLLSNTTNFYSSLTILFSLIW